VGDRITGSLFDYVQAKDGGGIRFVKISKLLSEDFYNNFRGAKGMKNSLEKG